MHRSGGKKDPLKANSKQQGAIILLLNRKGRGRTPCWEIPGLSGTYLDRKWGHWRDVVQAPFPSVQWCLWVGWKCISPFHYILRPCCLWVFSYCEIILKYQMSVALEISASIRYETVLLWHLNPLDVLSHENQSSGVMNSCITNCLTELTKNNLFLKAVLKTIFNLCFMLL